MRAAGTARIQQDLAWERQEARYLYVYERLLATAPAGRAGASVAVPG
jgi:hypothetical protein